MEAGSILSADVLDIIFDERNKDYGAYDLRKNYRRRLTKAVMVTMALVVLICLAYVVSGSMKDKKDEIVMAGIVTLEKVMPPVEKKIELPPPPAAKILPPEFKMIKDMVPVIVKDNEPVDEVPEQKDLDNALIGPANREGKDFDGTITPPVEESKGIVDAPKKQDKDDGGFLPVEIESQYPGGVSAWTAFLNRNLRYPQNAVDNELQGTVYIQFIVDAAGNVSDVTAVSGPQELRTAAIEVIKKSGKWTPALQNGRYTKSYKKQPITFRLADN